jgi:uncharacterized protein (TIGR03435 family)
MPLHLLIIASALAAPRVIFGQSDGLAQFEVVSIKPADGSLRPNYYGGPGSSDPNRIAYSRASLSNLIRDAFPGLHVDAPQSLDGVYFAVEAKLPPESTDAQLREMIRNMLVDRFGLVTHRETRNVPDYDLVFASSSPNLVRSTAGAKSINDSRSISGPVDRDGFPILPAGIRWQVRYHEDAMLMTFQDSSMSFLADRLTNVYHSSAVPVIDRTGLQGTYDFKLTLPLAPSRAPDPGVASDPEIGLANIAGLLKRQTGLSIRKGTTSMDYVIVDHVEKVPKPN